MRLRVGAPYDLVRIEIAIGKLRDARMLLRASLANKACDAVRRALKSADGARRHALRIQSATQRKQREGFDHA